MTTELDYDRLVDHLLGLARHAQLKLERKRVGEAQEAIDDLVKRLTQQQRERQGEDADGCHF